MAPPQLPTWGPLSRGNHLKPNLVVLKWLGESVNPEKTEWAKGKGLLQPPELTSARPPGPLKPHTPPTALWDRCCCSWRSQKQAQRCQVTPPGPHSSSEISRRLEPASLPVQKLTSNPSHQGVSCPTLLGEVMPAKGRLSRCSAIYSLFIQQVLSEPGFCARTCSGRRG